MGGYPRTWRDIVKSRWVTLGCCLAVFLLLTTYTLNSFDQGVDVAFRYPWGDDLITKGAEPSLHQGGVAGFTVFDNLWFHDGHFHYFSDTPLPIDGHAITTGSDSVITHPAGDLDAVLGGRKEDILRFRGETVFINTGYMSNRHLKLIRWYYHFAGEILLGAVSALSSVRVKRDHGPGQTRRDRLLDHLIVPREKYKDKYGLNEVIIDGALSTGLVDRNAWEGLQHRGARWIRFDRVVIVDREAAHSDPEVDKWNKMAVLALALPHPPTFFEPLRQRMAGYLDRLAPNRRQLGKAVASVPKVVYVNRQDNSRRLEAQAHADLLSLFKVMEARGQITFVHGIFGRRGYGVRDQMRVMLDADIVIGVHGNGLTHQLLMAPGGAVIEMFPPETFLRDYQVLAEALDNKHYAIRNDSIYTRPEWENHPGEQNAWRLHLGSTIPALAVPIPLQHNLVSTLVRKVVSDMSGQEVGDDVVHV